MRELPRGCEGSTPSLCIQLPYFVICVDLGGSGPLVFFSLIPTLVLLHLLVAKSFVHCLCWAGTFARSCRRIMWTVLIHVTVAITLPQKCPFPCGIWIPCLTKYSLGPRESVLQSRTLQPFLHSSPLCPTHRQTDTQTTLCLTSVAIGRIYAPRVGDAAYKL